MARDIEEFLRRAAERRQQQKAGQQPKAPQPPAQEVEIIQPEIVRPQVPSKRRPDVAKPKVKKQRRSVQKDMRNESVSDHVKSHLDTSRISEHAEELGDRIASVHGQVDIDVHKRLDHDINKIDDLPTITDDVRPGVIGADVPPIARELLEMLSKPSSIRQAILMREILDRPKWDDDDE